MALRLGKAKNAFGAAIAGVGIAMPSSGALAQNMVSTTLASSNNSARYVNSANDAMSSIGSREITPSPSIRTVANDASAGVTALPVNSIAVNDQESIQQAIDRHANDYREFLYLTVVDEKNTASRENRDFVNTLAEEVAATYPGTSITVATVTIRDASGNVNRDAINAVKHFYKGEGNPPTPLTMVIGRAKQHLDTDFLFNIETMAGVSELKTREEKAERYNHNLQHASHQVRGLASSIASPLRIRTGDFRSDEAVAAGLEIYRAGNFANHEDFTDTDMSEREYGAVFMAIKHSLKEECVVLVVNSQNDATIERVQSAVRGVMRTDLRPDIRVYLADGPEGVIRIYGGGLLLSTLRNAKPETIRNGWTFHDAVASSYDLTVDPISPVPPEHGVSPRRTGYYGDPSSVLTEELAYGNGS